MSVIDLNQVSIGLGGGSYVTETRDQQGNPMNVKVGPLSAGLNLLKEARVFTGDQSGPITATDIAVAAGRHYHISCAWLFGTVTHNTAHANWKLT